MNRTRRIGLGIAAVATLLWLLFLVAVLTGDPADGADIGAGLAALLALSLSLGASLVLLLSLRSGRSSSSAPAPPRRASERAAAALAGVSMAGLLAFLLLDPYAESDVLRRAALAVGVGAFLLSSATFAFTTRAGHASA
ncbi:hypothetical protein [Blastococcus haudaquaticus]|uniref:Uncharacterized protein n=1 Tax=Blastococcus haudaquaticus TaxID=1938745 RepID=A0A286GQ09_9ACTN|nr:hypothetical protein [Blastococcus haudaquaticus]SOD97276.1 hypothetical protein SAMN06272739_1400 [Blastococcus haudaquaticus]